MSILWKSSGRFGRLKPATWGSIVLRRISSSSSNSSALARHLSNQSRRFRRVQSGPPVRIWKIEVELRRRLRRSGKGDPALTPWQRTPRLTTVYRTSLSPWPSLNAPLLHRTRLEESSNRTRPERCRSCNNVWYVDLWVPPKPWPLPKALALPLLACVRECIVQWCGREAECPWLLVALLLWICSGREAALILPLLLFWCPVATAEWGRRVAILPWPWEPPASRDLTWSRAPPPPGHRVNAGGKHEPSRMAQAVPCIDANLWRTAGRPAHLCSRPSCCTRSKDVSAAGLRFERVCQLAALAN